MPPKWYFDSASKQRYRYSESQGRWIYESGKAVPIRQPSQADTVTPAQPSTDPRRQLAAISGSSADAAALADTLSRTTLRATAHAQGASSRGASTADPESILARDPVSGAETRWEFGATTPYADPTGHSQRSLNLKHIREVESRRPHKEVSGFNGSVSVTPEADYKYGRVIEVLLVPPPANEMSTISKITPSADFAERGGLRVRRFVIFNERPEGRRSFQALAIKTYNGDGVGASGVIKSHHCIIYTRKDPPKPDLSERPQSSHRGLMENGMQPRPIRVIAKDKATALDPMARLDFCDNYEFDYGVPNMRLFGWVDKDSLVALAMQHQAVLTAITSAVMGPTVQPETATSSTATATPGRGTVARNAASPAGPTTGQHLASLDSGRITDDQMRALLQRYQTHARENGLTVPGTKTTQQELRGLALDGQLRANWLKQIQARWRRDVESDSDS